MNKIPLLHEQTDFRDLLLTVTARERIVPQLVEKDYWLMHTLWALKSQGFRYEIKGGTSLSKGWKVIDRFSEDVDIKIFPPDGADVPIGKNQSNPSQRKKREEFFNGLKERIVVPGASGVERDTEFDDHDFRNAGLRVLYESQFDTLEVLKEGVLLEVGFDVTSPNELMTISSWAYDFGAEREPDVLDNRALEVPCYCPEYTLVEKLSAISKKYRQEKEGRIVPNFTRHYYDVFQLLDQPRVQGFLGTAAYYKHKKDRFHKDDEPDITRNEAFVLSDAVIRKRYSDRYRISSGLYLRSQPSIELIINRIQKYAVRL